VNEAAAAVDDDDSTDDQDGKAAGERRGSVDGAHLVLESRLRPHPARSTNYRRGRTVRPPPHRARAIVVVGAATAEEGRTAGAPRALQKQQHRGDRRWRRPVVVCFICTGAAVHLRL